MYSSTFFRRLFFSVLFTGLAANSSMAQSRVQARSYQDNRTFHTASPELAVDDSLSTSAHVDPGLVGGAALRVTFPTAVQAGQQGILIIKASTSLASVLGSMSLRTYSTTAQNPDSPVQSVPMSNPALVQITVAPDDPSTQQVKFTADQAFNQLELAADAVLNTNYVVDVYAVFGSVAPLPVELTAFLGKATEAGVALQWETASERDADHFDVQRAEGLADNFHLLGQVKCTGTSTQKHTYQFVDAAAGRNYYRLRQVDMNGTERFSPVVVVDAGVLASFTAYPTLTARTLHVSGSAGTHLHVLNQQGQQVQVADIAASQPQQLDVSGLPGGVYFLRDATTGLTARFIKTSGDH